MDWAQIVTTFVVLIISLTFHEAAHAWLAKLGGDLTAYEGGQVTLNPIPHIRREPFGMVVLPLVMLYSTGGRSCFGYAHAPVDPYWAARHPRKAAMMAAAGPLANFALVAVAWIVMFSLGHITDETERSIHKIAHRFFELNLILGVLNLIPFPPLDGASVVRGLAPKTGRTFDKILSVPFLPLIIFLLGAPYLIRYVVAPIYSLLGGWLDPAPWIVR